MYLSYQRKWLHVKGTPEEEKTEANRARKAMYAAEKKEQERQRDLDRRGFCLTCNILLPLTGKCPKCGTIWKFHKGGTIHNGI